MATIQAMQKAERKSSSLDFDLLLNLMVPPLGFLWCLPLAWAPRSQRDTRNLCSARGDLPRSRAGHPLLPHVLAHFLSDVPDAGQNWQGNLPSELELGSFCVFFLTHD